MAQPTGGTPVTRAFGWSSVGLSVAPLVAPAWTSRLLGVRDTPAGRLVVRGAGVQELAVGAGLLASRTPARWLWSRVAGDVAHLALLRRSTAARRSRRARVAAGMIVAVAAADLAAAVRLRRAPAATAQRRERVKAVTTVRRPPDVVYRRWRDFTSLPEFMYHLRSVRPAGDGRTHWVARGPAGRTVEWDAEVVRDEPGAVIAWRSVGATVVPNSGSVRFAAAPGGVATEVTVEMEYVPPGGRPGALLAKLFGEEPAQQVADDLRRFKQVLEVGEVVRSDGSPEGSRTHRQLVHKPARPAG